MEQWEESCISSPQIPQKLLTWKKQTLPDLALPPATSSLTPWALHVLTPPSTHVFPTSGPLHMLLLSPKMLFLQILNSLASPFPLGSTEISPPQRSLSRPQSSTPLLPRVVSGSLRIPSSNVSQSVMTVCLTGCLLCDTRDRYSRFIAGSTVWRRVQFMWAQ